ncbi:MAG: hypothetical protein JWM76_2859 [Pseudonocardiales bacterium]|nr:hypothetical protein [Pseudonocardiales bacterium]
MTESAVESEWEYAPLRIPADVSGVSTAVRLSLHAEYGGWELARTQRFIDGTRRVMLRRKRRPASLDDLPLPGLLP